MNPRSTKNPQDSPELPLRGPAPEVQGWRIEVAAVESVAAAIAHLAGELPEERREALRDKLHRYARKPDRVLIVARRSDFIAGFNCVIDRDTVPQDLKDSDQVRGLEDFACCNGLLVHPRYRRRGIGFSLQVEAESWARQRGRSGIWLITHRRAEWYQKHFGYREVGRTFSKGVVKRVMAKQF